MNISFKLFRSVFIILCVLSFFFLFIVTSPPTTFSYDANAQCHFYAERKSRSSAYATCKKRERESDKKIGERGKKCIDQIAIAQSLILSSLYLSFFFVASDCCVVVHHHLRHLFLSLSLSVTLSFVLSVISRSVKNTDDRQYHLHVYFNLLTSSS
jgi:hypothetical protein